MAKGSGATENINHFHSIRFRVVGQGNLNLSITTLDGIISKTLVPITLAQTNRTEPLRLINFVTQRAQLTISMGNFDDQMIVNKLVLFLKPIYSQLPA